MSKHNTRKTEEPITTNNYGKQCWYCGRFVDKNQWMCEYCKIWKKIVDYGWEVLIPQLRRKIPIKHISGPIRELPHSVAVKNPCS